MLSSAVYTDRISYLSYIIELLPKSLSLGTPGGLLVPSLVEARCQAVFSFLFFSVGFLGPLILQLKIAPPILIHSVRTNWLDRKVVRLLSYLAEPSEKLWMAGFFNSPSSSSPTQQQRGGSRNTNRNQDENSARNRQRGIGSSSSRHGDIRDVYSFYAEISRNEGGGERRRRSSFEFYNYDYNERYNARNFFYDDGCDVYYDEVAEDYVPREFSREDGDVLVEYALLPLWRFVFWWSLLAMAWVVCFLIAEYV